VIPSVLFFSSSLPQPSNDSRPVYWWFGRASRQAIYSRSVTVSINLYIL
jgi:hypothetical protein